MHPGFDRMGALASKEAQEYDPEALVEAMFAGSRAALGPLYDKLLESCGRPATSTRGTLR